MQHGQLAQILIDKKVHTGKYDKIKYAYKNKQKLAKNLVSGRYMITSAGGYMKLGDRSGKNEQCG